MKGSHLDEDKSKGQKRGRKPDLTYSITSQEKLIMDILRKKGMLERSYLISHFGKQDGNKHMTKVTLDARLKGLLKKGKIVNPHEGNSYLYCLPSQNNLLITLVEKNVQEQIDLKYTQIAGLKRAFLEISLQKSLDGHEDPLYFINLRKRLAVNAISELLRLQNHLQVIQTVFPHRRMQHRKMKITINELLNCVFAIIKKESDGKVLYSQVMKDLLDYDSPILLDYDIDQVKSTN